MVETQEVWRKLSDVCDPEIPVLSVIDLGIIRAVDVDADAIEIVITPTYSGCPAMNTIEDEIKQKVSHLGKVSVVTQLSPAWTTDWMSEEGKQKLKEYGIAPPVETGSGLFSQTQVACPRCGSARTKLVSQFGSTACKSFYQCEDCFEPFDHFKCHR